MFTSNNCIDKTQEPSIYLITMVHYVRPNMNPYLLLKMIYEWIYLSVIKRVNIQLFVNNIYDREPTQSNKILIIGATL